MGAIAEPAARSARVWLTRGATIGRVGAFISISASSDYQQWFFTMKTFRNAAMVAAVMLAVTTSPASACAGGGWRILHLEWLCCWIWGNNHKGCKQPESRP